jgi:hypothetical protein
MKNPGKISPDAMQVFLKQSALEKTLERWLPRKGSWLGSDNC